MADGLVRGPQVHTEDNILLGSVTESYQGCFCPPSWFLDICNASGEAVYRARAPMCAPCMCLPNCLCRNYLLAICHADSMEDTGAVIRNVFPGCNARGCCNALRQADNVQAGRTPPHALRAPRAPRGGREAAPAAA